MSTQNSAFRLERRHLTFVLPASSADVVKISTVPSVRRRCEALLAEGPVMRRHPCTPRFERKRDEALGAPFFLASVVHFAPELMAALALGVVGVGIGVLLSLEVHLGPTAVYGVIAGEFIWSIAQGANTDRPLEDVVTDTRALNGVEGAPMVGQQTKVLIHWAFFKRGRCFGCYH